MWLGILVEHFEFSADGLYLTLLIDGKCLQGVGLAIVIGTLDVVVNRTSLFAQFNSRFHIHIRLTLQLGNFIANLYFFIQLVLIQTNHFIRLRKFIVVFFASHITNNTSVLNFQHGALQVQLLCFYIQFFQRCFALGHFHFTFYDENFVVELLNLLPVIQARTDFRMFVYQLFKLSGFVSENRFYFLFRRKQFLDFFRLRFNRFFVSWSCRSAIDVGRCCCVIRF